MQDNREPGMAEVILILTILIVLTLIFREKIVELVAWFYRSLYR